MEEKNKDKLIQEQRTFNLIWWPLVLVITVMVGCFLYYLENNNLNAVATALATLLNLMLWVINVIVVGWLILAIKEVQPNH